MKKRLHYLTLLSLHLLSVVAFGQSNPTANRKDIKVEKLMTVKPQSVRIVYDPDHKKFYYSVFDSRDIYEVTMNGATATATRVNTAADHGIQEQMGGMIYYNGKLYLAGSIDSAEYIRGVVMKGTPGANSSGWTLVAKTEPYFKSNTYYDHRVNAIELDPTGKFFLVNSGSRSDHGEETYGVREQPVTSCIFKIPVDAENLILHNDAELIKPYIFVDGIRNSFGIAYNASGDVFGTENSGDRDHPDEINWLRPGKYYGFPWNMGGVDNPQQFPDYKPGLPPNKSLDPFIQSTASAWTLFQSFKTDSTFPAKPDTLDFMLPILNLGPDADKYRDPVDFKVKDASDLGTIMYGVSPHRSPAGIVFDRDGNIGSDLHFGGFVASFNNSGLLAPFEKGGDLTYLDLKYIDSIDNYGGKITQLVKGFNVPSDVEIVGNELYVIEFSYSANGALWRITLPKYDGYNAVHAIETPVIDGNANETIWDSSSWAAINQPWVGNMASATDYEGKYKVCWNGSRLYFLVDIYDDVDAPMLPEDNTVDSYWNFDNVEIFIDENHSGGDHQNNNNAFAYHISPTGKVADICPGGAACDLSKNVEVVRKTDTVGIRIHSVWEIGVDIYDDKFNLNVADNSASLVKLTKGKVMGFAVSSGDNDKGHGQERDNLFGSVYIAGNNKNVAWQNASVFDKITLVNLKSEDDTTINTIAIKSNLGLKISLFPIPVEKDLKVSLKGTYNGNVQWRMLDISGKEIMKGNLKKSGFESSQNINCTSLEAGTYMIQFISNNKTETRKFIK